MKDQEPRVKICCVLDENPRFYVEFILWVICVKRQLPQNFRPTTYTVGNTPEDIGAWAGEMDIPMVPTARVVDGAPHCNKIAPFHDDHVEEFIAVTDTDLFFLKDPSSLIRGNRFRAAPNNHGNPPPKIFKNILAESGLDRSYRPGVALFAGRDGNRETHINNISAGIVIAPRARAAELADRWKCWAQWLVGKQNLLADWSGHIDQISFALAMEEMGEDVEFLPPQINTILHLVEEISTCYALHLTTGHIPLFPELFNEKHFMRSDLVRIEMRPAVDLLNNAIEEALDVMRDLPSTRDHLDKFLNPVWIR